MSPRRRDDGRPRPYLDAAQKLVALTAGRAVVLVIAYFVLGAIVVIRTGDATAIADIGRAAAELVRAFTGYLGS